MAKTYDMPLKINLRSGPIVINTPEEAIRFMESNWPADRGVLYNLARRKIEQSLADPSYWNAARLSLQAAISTIDMFPRGRERRHPDHL